jgi:hypothetical protein
LEGKENTMKTISNKNLIIISPRRSGSHFLKDVLLNNFNYAQKITNIEDIENLQDLENMLKTDYNIFNTHSNDPNILKKVEGLDNIKKIYLIRDSKDITTSTFFYKDVWKNHTFEECCNYCLNILKEYQKNWHDYLKTKSKDELFFSFNQSSSTSNNNLYSFEVARNDVLLVAFDQLRNNNLKTTETIKDFIKYEKRFKYVDVTLKEGDNINGDKTIFRNPNFFRRGVTGDHKNHMSEEWIRKFTEELLW